MTFLSLVLYLFQADNLEGHHLLGATAIFLDTFPNLARLREEFSGYTYECWWANSLQGTESSPCQQAALSTTPGNTSILPVMPWVGVTWEVQMAGSTGVGRHRHVVCPAPKTHSLQYVFALIINPGL